MKPIYEYEILIFELNEHHAHRIKEALNQKGSQGYIVASANEFGGFKSTKKVMYTLMREAPKPYDRFPQPKSKFIDAPTEQTFRSRVRDVEPDSE